GPARNCRSRRPHHPRPEPVARPVQWPLAARADARPLVRAQGRRPFRSAHRRHRHLACSDAGGAPYAAVCAAASGIVRGGGPMSRERHWLAPLITAPAALAAADLASGIALAVTAAFALLALAGVQRLARRLGAALLAIAQLLAVAT